MFRNYLINIHRFYNYFYKGEMDSPIMPAIVFSLTLTSVAGSMDIVFNNRDIINRLEDIHRLMIGLPNVVIMLVVYFWYRLNLPTKKELNINNGMWFGVILCILSVLCFLATSVFFN